MHDRFATMSKVSSITITSWTKMTGQISDTILVGILSQANHTFS